jgi:hypothetical protein
MPYSYPSLTPAYGLGSYGRTGAALLISSPRTKIGSQGRIYNFFKGQNERAAYVNYLKQVIGPQPQYNASYNFSF